MSIIMKLLLFGAGASIPFFRTPLTTNYITQEMSKEERWKPILKCYWEKSHIHFLSAHKICRIIRELIKRHPDYNFEDVCEAFDKLTLYQWPYVISPNFKLTIQDLRACNVIRYYKTIKIGIALPFLYRCILLSIILDNEEGHCSDYTELIKRQRLFLEKYSDDKEKVSIISLNYDDCLYTSTKRIFNTGFISDGENLNRCIFSSHKFLHSSKTISFLHGNIRFDSNHFTPEKIIDYQTRIANIDNPILTSLYDADSYSFNTFLTTGKSKEESLNYNPYAMYYQKMASDILHYNEIIIIGYSFNDNHINRMLINYWEADYMKRLIIVDYCKYIFDYEHTENIPSIIGRIHDLFSTPFNDDIHDIKEFNKNGYGYLFPKILLYTKGYEAFLKEYSSVLTSCSDSICLP